MLNNLPSLRVDRQSCQVNLRGNFNVLVLVDEKPSNIPLDQFLKYLYSNTIDKIEIITNHSVKYNLEGNSGILNIILKKDRQKGYYISLNIG
ncbi:MAG: hypothetical protein ACMUEM_02680 [Flavobacteriales bacterium AspAUS03]